VTIGGGGRRRLLAVGIVVAAGCLVAACTGGEPEPTPPVETSVAPSPTPTPEPTETGPTKPDRPAAMDRDDAEGAAAAAEYFIGMYPYVMATGDLTEWEAMAHAECDACTDLAADAKRRAENGDTFTGGVTTARVVDPEKYYRDEATGIFPLDVEVIEEATTITSSSGETLYDAPRSEYTRRVEMGRNDGSWVVVEITEVPQP